MQAYDLIMLIVLVGATLIGFRKGLVWQVASLAAIFVSYLVAMQFRDQLAPRMPYGDPWNKFLAMLVLYLGTSLGIWFLFRMVSGVIDQAKLSDFDRQLGALLGAAKGVVLCVIITLFAVALLKPEQREAVINSKSGFYIAGLLHKSRKMIPPELHEVLDPYLTQLDQRLTPEQRQKLDEQPLWPPAGTQSASGGPSNGAPAMSIPWGQSANGSGGAGQSAGANGSTAPTAQSMIQSAVQAAAQAALDSATQSVGQAAGQAGVPGAAGSVPNGGWWAGEGATNGQPAASGAASSAWPTTPSGTQPNPRRPAVDASDWRQ